MPMGAGQQFDHVERESWRPPEPWRPPPETRKDWGIQDILVTSFPSGQTGVRAKLGLSSASVSSAILQVESPLLLPSPSPSPLPQGLGFGLSQLLALFPFLKKPSLASFSPPDSLLGSLTEGHRGGVKANPLLETRLCKVWGCVPSPPRAPTPGVSPCSRPRPFQPPLAL